jgi:hypothetical protein
MEPADGEAYVGNVRALHRTAKTILGDEVRTRAAWVSAGTTPGVGLPTGSGCIEFIKTVIARKER